MVWGTSFGLRFFLRPLSLWWTQRLGLKPSFILGVIVYAGIFPVLAQVHTIGLWFWILIFYLAISDIAYYLPFHSLYAALGDIDSRGSQIAVREIFALTFGIAAPIVGSFIVITFGYGSLYVVATIVMLIGVLPLLYIPDFTANTVMGFKEAFKFIDFRGFWLMLGDGIKVQAEAFVWVVTIFFLATSLSQFGWLIALKLLFVAILYLTLGKLVDGGHSKKIFLYGSIGLIFTLIARAFFVTDVTGIVVAQFILAFVLVFYQEPFDTLLYNLAKRTKSTLWFHFFGEAGADFGAMIVFFSSAALVHYGVDIQYVLLVGILSIIVVKPILDRALAP